MSQNVKSLPTVLRSILDAELNPRLAFVFPGQGAQKVGMGHDAFQSSEAAREVFFEADATLGQPISSLCFDGPHEQLTETTNAQPAILVTSISYLVAASQAGALQERPAFLAGHSLGHYTALVAAESLSLEQALILVHERGRLMSEAGRENPGAMAAILGLSEEAVTDICRASGAEPANYNGPTQTVVGGPPQAVKRASALAREAGGKALPVNVSGAFHTSLMKAAAAAYSRLVTEADISNPLMPVISNVTALPLTAAEAVREDLALQMTRPVQWSATVEYMLSNGVDTFVEIGPGRNLTGMLKRISPESRPRNIDSVDALASV